MAPFRALRYNPAKISFISRVVAPPFDVIDADRAEELRQRDPHNVIRLILGKGPEDGRPPEDYEYAAETLSAWRRDGFLMVEPEPAVYACEQAFELDHQQYVRRGLVCAVLLEEFSAGNVFPHERTMSGPKADRLRLMEASGANLSQVFGLLPDRDGRADALIKDMAAGLPLYEFRGADTIVHKVWRCQDEGTICELADLLRAEDLVIADGHHRYETALAYQHAHRAGSGPPGTAAEDFLLVFCASVRNPGLKVLATHRLVKAPSGFDLRAMIEALREQFEIAEHAVPGPGGLRGLFRAPRVAGDCIGCYLPGERLLVLRPRSREVLAEQMPPRLPAWQRLPVTQLHYAILAPYLELPPDREEADPRLTFTHSIEEVYWAVEGGRSDVAFLLPPLQPEAVTEVATGGERMPPKSTFFYPKVPSGLLFYAFDEGVPQIPVS
ncbi:MAG: DUF1015 domain-containing protein [Planctomycetota bacterium]